MPQELNPLGLLNSYEHALEFFDDSLMTLRALITAQRTEQRLPDSDFLDRYEHALETFDDALMTLRALIKTQRTKPPLPDKTLQLLDQCTAAAVAVRKSRAV